MIPILKLFEPILQTSQQPCVVPFTALNRSLRNVKTVEPNTLLEYSHSIAASAASILSGNVIFLQITSKCSHFHVIHHFCTISSAHSFHSISLQLEHHFDPFRIHPLGYFRTH